MEKRAFYVAQDGFEATPIFLTKTLRNRFILWNISRFGLPDELPEGFWIVTLNWRDSPMPGLLFREA